MTDSFHSESPSVAQRRSAPRYSLIASTEITEPASGARMSGRISEISRTGCYLDLLNTLPAGTSVHIRVIRDKGIFESDGKIVYVQDRMGMGIAFTDVSAEQQQILDSWVEELKAQP